MGVTCSKKNKIATVSLSPPPLPSFLPPSPSSQISSFSQPLPSSSPPPLLNPISPPSRPFLSQFSPVNSNDRRNSQYSLSKFRRVPVRETHEVSRERSESGIKKINNYFIEDFLGQGAFAKVKLGRKKLMDREKLYAIKIIKKSKLKKMRNISKNAEGSEKLIIKDAYQNVLREIALMKKMDHPNIIRLHEVIFDEEKGKLYLVLEYAEKGQLIEWDEENEKFYFVNGREEKYMKEEDLLPIFQDCVLGLVYLHSHSIIHRDIKPQNILFSSSTAKLADFGISDLLTSSSPSLNQGTSFFMAPELFAKPPLAPSQIDWKAVDIWALGVTFFSFVFMKLPFFGGDEEELIEKIKEENVNWGEKGISEELKDLLEKMLDKDPKKRINVEEIGEHKWMKGNGFDINKLIGWAKEIQVEEKDLNEVFIPLERIIFMKSCVKKMRQGANLRVSSIRNLLGNQHINRINTTENIGENNDIKLQYCSFDSSPEIRRE